MLKDKVAIITGASVGIGKATALEFAKNGAKVAIVDIDEEKLNSVKSEIEEMGGLALSFIGDISDENRVFEIVDEVILKLGKVDILINNAGIWRMFSKLVDSESESWKKMIDVNILGTMYFSKAVIPNMTENKFGRIINVGSVAGTYGNVNMVPYSMTKGAISSFTKALAKEVAEDGITVNNVVPGSVKNEGVEDNANFSFIPRLGKLEEYAYLICFLASNKAAYISGQDYQIDGCRKKM